MSPVLVNALLFVVGLAALYYGAEWVVRGGARFAGSFGVSPIVVGLTVVSLGTSAPELVVGVAASLRESGELAVGNVLGSNLANMGLILGVASLVRPIRVSAVAVRREIPVMLLVTALIFPVVWDLSITRFEGLLLLLLLGAYLAYVLRAVPAEALGVEDEYEKFGEEHRFGGGVTHLKHLLLVAVGLLALSGGAHITVESALFFADRFGVPELVVGITVVAVGTSLPELATSVVAAVREEADIAVGNVIGSNIFNLSGILGSAALVHPIAIGESVRRLELPAVFLFSLLLVPLLWTGFRLRRREGALLLATYLGLGVLFI